MIESIKDKAVMLKFYFDISASFMIIINFLLLVLTASDKLKELFGLSGKTVVIGIVLGTFIGTVIFGFILDRYINYISRYSKIAIDRNPQTVEILSRIKSIEEKMTTQKNKKGKEGCTCGLDYLPFHTNSKDCSA